MVGPLHVSFWKELKAGEVEYASPRFGHSSSFVHFSLWSFTRTASTVVTRKGPWCSASLFLAFPGQQRHHIAHCQPT